MEDPAEHRPLPWTDSEALDSATRETFDDLMRSLLREESTAFAARAVPEGAEDVELPAQVQEELRSLGYF